MKTFAASVTLRHHAMSLSARRLSLEGLAVLSLLLSLAPGVRAAPDISQIKLFGKWTNPASGGNYLGSAVALSDKWALVGSYAASEQASSQGAVQVFNAATGVWVRKLLPPGTSTSNTFFGCSLAIVGDLGVIGAYGVGSGQGAAYVYNLVSGALVRTLFANDGVPGDGFGSSCAAQGTKVLIGANGRDGAKGAAYLFDLPTGLQLNRFDLGGTGVALDSFGSAVALDGNLGLIGAWGCNTYSGAAYLYDMTTFQLLNTYLPGSVGHYAYGESVALDGVHAVVGGSGLNGGKGAVSVINVRTGNSVALLSTDSSLVGEAFGSSVSACDGKLLVGARNTNNNSQFYGAAYLYDLGQSGFPRLAKITAIDAQAGQNFGQRCALCGNAGLVGAPGSGASDGAAYLLRPLISPLPLTKVVAQGDLAPGLPNATFYVLGDAYINLYGEVAFGARLTGPGTAGTLGTRASGVWTSLRTPGSLQASHIAGDILGTASISQMATPIANGDYYTVYLASYRAGVGGVTAANNKTVIIENGVSASSALATGTTTAPFGTAKLKDFTELVQTETRGYSPSNWAVTCTLVPDAATFTTAANDSGVFIYPGLEGAREGAPIPSGAGDSYGQFSGRVSYHYTDVFFHAAATGLVAKNQVIMRYTPGTGASLLARKGDPAPDIGDAALLSLLGEAADGSNRALYRATLLGTDPISPRTSFAVSNGATLASTHSTVTTLNNEALFTNIPVSGSNLALRKGQSIGVAGLTISRFVQSWPLGRQGTNEGSELLALVVLAGPGVTTANDQALLEVMGNGSVSVLMREGQTAGGCTNATIGVISRVEVDSFSSAYAVLTTLVGATVGADQALYTGSLDVSLGLTSPQGTLRRPFLFLRKGQVYENQPGKIRSISLPVADVPASGVGGTGRGRAISEFYIAVTIEFDNNVRQIMKGHLP